VGTSTGDVVPVDVPTCCRTRQRHNHRRSGGGASPLLVLRRPAHRTVGQPVANGSLSATGQTRSRQRGPARKPTTRCTGHHEPGCAGQPRNQLPVRATASGPSRPQHVQPAATRRTGATATGARAKTPQTTPTAPPPRILRGDTAYSVVTPTRATPASSSGTDRGPQHPAAGSLRTGATEMAPRTRRRAV